MTNSFQITVVLFVFMNSINAGELHLVGGGGGPKVSRRAHRLSFEVFDLRPGRGDIAPRTIPQNIDMGDNRRWYERLLDCLSRMCGSRERRQPLTPIRAPSPITRYPLRRTNSVYPGRGQDDIGE